MVHARPVQPPTTVPPTCLVAGLLRDDGRREGFLQLSAELCRVHGIAPLRLPGD